MIKKFFSSLIKYIWLLFINGLLTLLPIAITLSVFSFSFKMIKGWLAPLNTFLDKIPYLSDIPHAEIILAILIIFGAGIVLKSFIMRSILDLLEGIVEYVPLVRPVYTGINQLVHAFSPTDTATFKDVVLVEFPRKGMYSIGFKTTQMARDISPDKEHDFYNIFVPTTPNPTTGYFIVVRQEDFTAIDLTTQEAMALIISGGIVQPHRFKQ